MNLYIPSLHHIKSSSYTYTMKIVSDNDSNLLYFSSTSCLLSTPDAKVHELIIHHVLPIVGDFVANF